MSTTPELIADAIPLLDVSAYLAGDGRALQPLTAELRWAFENVGFYYLRGHGIDGALIAATYDAAARFHAQPLPKKLAVRTDEHNIGYLPMAAGQTTHGRRSRNDAYFVRRERRADDPHVVANRRFHAMNRWPDAVPGFRETALAYMRALERLCQRLVPIYAVALDMPPDTFDAAYAEPHIILRMSHYPPLDDDDDDVSLVPHTDSGFMTLLAPNPVPGLSIQLPDGRWIDAPGVEDAFVVNGGDILHRWTNERFLSTPHRVVNRSRRDRYAIPFFCDPNHDTVIECLPTCASPGNPAKYPPVTFADYAVWFARKSYQHLAIQPGPDDATVAPGERATRRW
jgi:isopenicillin N synthase-like dioxygenase